uniref:Uncharacterized protein n=1 Tax=Aegilops tauschii TaxID=37682 RepID=M8BCZ6_AEGTA
MASPSARAAHDHPSSYLLELAAADDLPAFRRAVQEDNLSLVAASPWYGPSPKPAGASSNRRTTQQLALHLRTPAMVAALYGSTTVLSYVLSIAPSEAARASASDGATPLLLAHAGRAPSAPHAARLLLSAGASSSSLLALDHHQNRLPSSPTKKDTDTAVTTRKTAKKDYSSSAAHAHSDAAQTEDINAGVFATDDFRMYSFKMIRLADWGSPDGKLDWGVQGAELRKSTSFGVRSSSRTHDATRQEDMYSSWMNDGGSDMLAARWSDLEQMVA